MFKTKYIADNISVIYYTVSNQKIDIVVLQIINPDIFNLEVKSKKDRVINQFIDDGEAESYSIYRSFFSTVSPVMIFDGMNIRFTIPRLTNWLDDLKDMKDGKEKSPRINLEQFTLIDVNQIILDGLFIPSYVNSVYEEINITFKTVTEIAKIVFKERFD